MNFEPFECNGITPFIWSENQKIITVLPYNFQVTTTTFINDILEINRIESNSVELEKYHLILNNFWKH
jgi:hypothetical protein